VDPSLAAGGRVVGLRAAISVLGVGAVLSLPDSDDEEALSVAAGLGADRLLLRLGVGVTSVKGSSGTSDTVTGGGVGSCSFSASAGSSEGGGLLEGVAEGLTSAGFTSAGFAAGGGSGAGTWAALGTSAGFAGSAGFSAGCAKATLGFFA